MSVFILISIMWTILTITTRTSAQENDHTPYLEQVLEMIAENNDEIPDVSAIGEELGELAAHPLNINLAGEKELQVTGLFNDIQIRNILEYRKNTGPLYSIYELNAVDGFTPEILVLIRPFIRFDFPGNEFVGETKRGNDFQEQLILRAQVGIPESEEYKPDENGEKAYEGNSMRYYTKYRMVHETGITAGFTAEKDPGEAFFTGSNPRGFDFFSGHISYTPGGAIRNITVGDFTVRSGQGLVIWQGFSTGKSTGVSSIMKTGAPLKPYTSSSEYGYFRGLAASLELSGTTVTLFYSRKKEDANLIFKGDSLSHFSSLQTSGYHRSPAEVEDENSVLNQCAGVLLTRNISGVKLGLSSVFQHFQIPMIRSDQLYNLYRWSGKNNLTGGLNYQYALKKWMFFGEAGISASGGMAFLQGLVARLHDQISLSALYRNYARHYHAPYASSFGETGDASNESGLFSGIHLLPFRFVTLSGYADLYRSPWTRYTTTGPSGGHDFQVQADVRVSRRILLFLRYKNEEKDKKMTVSPGYVNYREKIQRGRLHFQYLPGESVLLRSRYERVFFQGKTRESGRLAFVDFQYKPGHKPFGFSTRVTWFDTDGYSSRIYAYENDMLYTFPVSTFFDSGIQSYLNMKYRVGNSLDCWLKLAGTFYTKKNQEDDSNTTGKPNSHKTEIKFQVRLRL